MFVSKTTMLFNLKFQSNYIELNLNFFPSQIISLWMKNIGNLKNLYLKWGWSFSLQFFGKVVLGFASLYDIQMKSSKTVCLTEQCQSMSNRNSVHSVRRGTKMSKTSCPWYRHLTVYSVMHLKLKHVFAAFLSYWLNAIQMHKCKFLCPNCTFKGKLLICKYWFRPLIHFW